MPSRPWDAFGSPARSQVPFIKILVSFFHDTWTISVCRRQRRRLCPFDLFPTIAHDSDARNRWMRYIEGKMHWILLSSSLYLNWVVWYKPKNYLEANNCDYLTSQRSLILYSKKSNLCTLLARMSCICTIAIQVCCTTDMQTLYDNILLSYLLRSKVLLTKRGQCIESDDRLVACPTNSSSIQGERKRIADGMKILAEGRLQQNNQVHCLIAIEMAGIDRILSIGTETRAIA